MHVVLFSLLSLGVGTWVFAYLLSFTPACV